MELKGIIAPEKLWEERCFTVLVYAEDDTTLRDSNKYYISVNEDMYPKAGRPDLHVLLSTTDEQVDGCRVFTPETNLLDIPYTEWEYQQEYEDDEEEWDSDPFEKF